MGIASDVAQQDPMPLLAVLPAALCSIRSPENDIAFGETEARRRERKGELVPPRNVARGRGAGDAGDGGMRR